MSWVANVMVSVDPEDRRNVEALSAWLRSDAPLRDRLGGGCGFLAATTGQDSQWGGWKFPECHVWAGALNHADLAAVLDRVRATAWRCPNVVQVFVMDQEEMFFRVWMLRDGKRHLALVLGEYLAHYNASRPHQSRDQRPPDLETLPARNAADLTDLQTIRRRPVIAGLISEYHHAA